MIYTTDSSLFPTALKNRSAFKFFVGRTSSALHEFGTPLPARPCCVRTPPPGGISSTPRTTADILVVKPRTMYAARSVQKDIHPCFVHLFR